jgi:hypothetical protein
MGFANFTVQQHDWVFIGLRRDGKGAISNNAPVAAHGFVETGV